ncbi:DMT family transporter [Isachenkonia alkalipeptolytica]|uniref:DMT family transporter n=1 Tax=Isachenkonia alkalipeptolytica TaxID=2565777 RepID=A0AA43XNN6_9CLOT|nr:DMT family transporter [Isachenkonia alkalipeptolytica]NBG89644.1 DMT family transporter [Isachenkonia alkalipeptolytica]
MKDHNKGILLMILASLCFALMASAVKYTGEIPTMQIVFFRNLIGMLISGYMIYRTGGNFKGKNRGGLIFRSIFGLTGVFLYFYALGEIPLSDAVVLNQMSPFFVVILSAWFLKEPIKKLQIPAVFLAMLGVIFIIRPEFNATILPSLIALMSAFFAAAAYTTIRHLRLTDKPQVIIFYFTAFSVLVAIPFMALGQFQWPTPLQFLSLLGVGVFATGAQFLMTYAYRYAQAGDLSIYSYGKTVFSTLIGAVIWLEIPDQYSLIGILFILTGAYVNYYASKKKVE